MIIVVIIAVNSSVVFRKHGISIAYLQMAKAAIKEIRFPESYTSHLTLTEMYREISQLNTTINTLLERWAVFVFIKISFK